MTKSKKLAFVLQEGEGYQIEFKERISDLDKEIVAFANGSGGSIFLGVRDDGSIKKIELTNTLKSQIVDIAQNCDPSIKVSLNYFADEKVLEVIIPEGPDKSYRCKEGFFLRVGPNSQKLKRDEIVQLIQASGKIPFDQNLNPSFAYPSDFSPETLDSFLKCCEIHTPLAKTDILINLGVGTEKKIDLYQCWNFIFW
jgi:ATP-dependent DNA helicase RecG